MMATKTKSKSGKVVGKNAFADVAVITLNDFQRIQNTTKTTNLVEEHNNKSILKVQTQQKFATHNNLKEKMKQIDAEKLEREKNSKEELDSMTLNKLLIKAKNAVDYGFDELKEMDKIAGYSKVATIRKRQIEQTEMMKKEYLDQERKMAEMMEIDRLKELEYHEHQKAVKKEQIKLGSYVITDQIKDKEIERIRQKEHQEKERQMMFRQIKELEQEEKRNHEMKRIQTQRMAVETLVANKRAAEVKEQRIYEEKELDLKMIQYAIEKAKKEEDELAEKKRIQAQKEKDTQKLREKQERAQDKQAMNDAVRAKRAYEDAERKARIKEREEILLKQRKVHELLEANAKALNDKAEKREFETKKEQTEYEKIVERQKREIEAERKKEDEMKNMKLAHGEDVKKQIDDKKELYKLKEREVIEDAKALRQAKTINRTRLELEKEAKLKELRELGVEEKFIGDLQKYKIK